ncbi:phosphatidylserine/phosphatidylglycerophosphate/cardiolipin synthase family protein [Streptomyces harbinensis]|uniref:phospholipase D-like domain-containing protein n=1 Tax=Streptomyces harbinensis TaxID=1176198 RepID=UPI00371642BB
MRMTLALRLPLSGLLALALTALLTVTAASTATGAAGTAAVGSYTVFNAPADGEPDHTLEDHLVDLIDGAPAGSAIHGAMYTWTRTPVAEALARAQARGVRVSLAVDKEGEGGSNSSPANAAIATLKDAGLTRLVLCGNTSVGNSSCIANRSNSLNHNKFFTFSATGGLSEVVFLSSANLTNPQLRLYNNAVVIHGDAELRGAFLRHMDNLLAQRRNNNYSASADGYFRSPVSDIRVFFPPRADSSGGTGAEASTDLVVGRLRYITRYEPGCALDVAHAQFTGPRAPVADELIRIARLGCAVRVVGGDNMTDYIRDRLAGHANLTVRGLDSLHSKYIVYTGDYNGTAGRSLVFTGSHNLTGPSLRAHDETMIRVELPGIADDYLENFGRLWAQAR